MTHRIGSKGQVVIPKELRERAGLHPGTQVDFEIDGDKVTLVPHRPLRSLGGMFKGSGMAQRLLEDRAREPR
jgi:antitoxin PrlF